jgi:hypothetical protein
VHIYSSTQTYKAYHLTEADFAAEVYLGGTLSGSIAGYSPVGVIAYADAECDTAIAESEVTGNAWDLAVEDTATTVWFKVKLEKDGSNDYYSTPVSESGFSFTGRTNIVLAVEGYTVTFDAKGGVFEGGDGTMTMTAPENGTLSVLPSAAYGTYGFGGWFSAGETPFTMATPVIGYTALSAKWVIPQADIASYLSGAGGGTSGDPVPLAVNVDLGSGGLADLLTAIATGGKYVALDLSTCSMDGTEFDPGTGTGADKVTALVLPNGAESVAAGDWGDSTFQAFTALTSISGAGVEAIGEFAFADCASLTEVSLPAVVDIGAGAFGECTSLTEVSLPAATTIGDAAFGGCTSLTGVSLPAAETIGEYAFIGTNLT